MTRGPAPVVGPLYVETGEVPWQRVGIAGATSAVETGDFQVRQAASPDFSHSSLMRSLSVFEDLGRGLSRLERPGYWQNPGRLWRRRRRVNRGGFAFNPHVLAENAETPPRPSSAKRENQPECEKCGLAVSIQSISTLRVNRRAPKGGRRPPGAVWPRP